MVLSKPVVPQIVWPVKNCLGPGAANGFFEKKKIALVLWAFWQKTIAFYGLLDSSLVEYPRKRVHWKAYPYYPLEPMGPTNLLMFYFQNNELKVTKDLDLMHWHKFHSNWIWYMQLNFFVWNA